MPEAPPPFANYPRGGFLPMMPVSFDVISQAMQRFSSRPWFWMAVALPMGLTMVLSGGISFIAQLIYMPPGVKAPDLGTFFSVFAVTYTIQILLSVVSYVFFAGMIHAAIRSIRGEPVEFGNALSNDGRVLSIVGAILSIGVIVIVGSMCCYLPGLILMGLSTLTLPLITDQRMGTFEAMTRSFELMKPYLWVATGLSLVLPLLASLSILLCGVGWLAGMAFWAIAVAQIYCNFYPGPERELSVGMPPPPYPLA